MVCVYTRWFSGLLYSLLGQHHAGRSVHSAYAVYDFSNIGSIEMERKGGRPLFVCGSAGLWFERRESWNGGLLPSRYFNFVFFLVPARPVEAPFVVWSVFSVGVFGLPVLADPFFNGTHF
jgi:hypothetical protein